MKNIFKMIPRWNSIYSFSVEGKERCINDVCYNIVAMLSSEGKTVKQIRFFEDHGCHVVQIFCSRYTFYTFLSEYKERTKKYVWEVYKVR